MNTPGPHIQAVAHRHVPQMNIHFFLNNNPVISVFSFQMGDAKGVTFAPLPGESSFGDPSKVSPLDELLDLLRKALEFLLCCVTCGCYPPPGDRGGGGLQAEVGQVELMEEEKAAVSALLDYLDSGKFTQCAHCTGKMRKTGKITQKYFLSERHGEFGIFAKIRRILFAQVVISQILKV